MENLWCAAPYIRIYRNGPAPYEFVRFIYKPYIWFMYGAGHIHVGQHMMFCTIYMVWYQKSCTFETYGANIIDALFSIWIIYGATYGDLRTYIFVHAHSI